MESYVKGRELGRGAMGVVFEARRVSDGESFAVKTSAFSHLSSSEQAASLREVRLLARLKHPAIVRYADAFMEGSELCIVMEAAGGGSLEDEIKAARSAGAPLPEARLLDILVSVGGALAYVHSCRAIHRDVKPANILLDSQGNPKLADFGISTTVRAHALQTGRCLCSDHNSAAREEAAPRELLTGLEGTPYYLAPELFEDSLQRGSCMYSAASDVWAFGVVMYELACLKRPYTGDSLPSLAFRIVADLSQNAMRDLPSPLPYSRDLTQAVEAMLHKRPAMRASLSEILSRGFADGWARGRGTEPPAVINLLEAKRAALSVPIADVYGWGRGRSLPGLREDLMGLVVVCVACGGGHCAVVCDEGRLYSWGENEQGQCGHGDFARLSRRRPVIGIPEVKSVACGSCHTAIVSRGGEVLCCGSHERGQLGVGEGSELLDAMRRLPFFYRLEAGGGCSSLACGEAHSLALGERGVLGWGCADDGRIGPVEEGEEVVSSPRLIPLECAALQVGCGVDFSAVLDEQGVVWGFGASYSLQLGVEEEEVSSPRELFHSCAVAQLSCGADHMALIDARGKLWLWGGRFGEPHEVSPPGEEAWGVVACGGEMVVATTEGGDCYSWGSGECGRLGLDDGCKEHSTPQRIERLSRAAGVRVVAAACGGSTLDEGPLVLALALPEKAEALEEQFERHFLAG